MKYWTVKVPHIVYEEILVPKDEEFSTIEDAIYAPISDERFPPLADSSDLNISSNLEWAYRIASTKEFLVIDPDEPSRIQQLYPESL